MSPWSDTAFQGGGDFERESYSQAHRCDHCRKLLIRYGYMDEDEPEQWLPIAGAQKEFSDVPVEIASLAMEAHNSLSANAGRGAVILARAVIEATAKDKGITNGNLYAKIDQLHTSGLIREHIKEAAHEVRLGGNDVAHGDILSGPFPYEETVEILTLMDEVLLEVYQSPARVERARQQRLNRQRGSLNP